MININLYLEKQSHEKHINKNKLFLLLTFTLPLAFSLPLAFCLERFSEGPWRYEQLKNV